MHVIILKNDMAPKDMHPSFHAGENAQVQRFDSLAICVVVVAVAAERFACRPKFQIPSKTFCTISFPTFTLLPLDF